MTTFRILAVSDISQPQKPMKRDASTSGRILETLIDEEAEESRPGNRCLRLVLQALDGGPLVSACELVLLPFGLESISEGVLLEVTNAEESHGLVLLTPSNTKLVVEETTRFNQILIDDDDFLSDGGILL